MPVTSYLDFELAIAPAPDGYRARVQRAPSDEAQASFALPFTEQELSDFLRRAGWAGCGQMPNT